MRADTHLDRPFEDAILDLFQRRGLRATHPRRLIAGRIAALRHEGTDFSAEDLWHELQQSDPHIGRSTVFRSVDLLVRENVLDRIPTANGRTRYRPCPSHHHHHVTCTACNRVVAIDICLSPDVMGSVASDTHFEIDSHRLELFGRCPECISNGVR